MAPLHILVTSLYAPSYHTVYGLDIIVLVLVRKYSLEHSRTRLQNPKQTMVVISIGPTKYGDYCAFKQRQNINQHPWRKQNLSEIISRRRRMPI